MAIESEKSLQRLLLRTTTDMDQQEGVTLAVRRKTSLLIFLERALIGAGLRRVLVLDIEGSLRSNFGS
ncbi:MAG: hypothetical protein ACK5PZ_07170 [Pirellula sp.]